MKRRVVVTGMGVITPLGNDVPTFWEGLLAGRSGIGPITQFDPSEIEVRIAGEVRDFDPEERFDRRTARRNDPFTLFALGAARQAVADARLALSGDEDDVGVVIGTGIGGVRTLLEGYDVLQERGPHRVSALMTPMMMANAAAGMIAITYGLHGPNFCLTSACATGSNAIGEAGQIVQLGRAEVMICGGSESAIHPLSLSAFKNMGAVSTRNDEPQRASRPFDADRDGFVLGEGAGILILESLEHALERDAPILCELIGYGASADGYHVTAPDQEGRGAALAMKRALQSADLPPEEVDYINAHGTSTPFNDPIETKAIRTVFGPHADRLVVSSTKSMIGHLMGAAGAVEAVASIKSLETGWVHPTINYETPDPDCDLDYVPNQARKVDPQVVLSNSFGFGGHNGCLIFRRWEGAS